MISGSQAMLILSHVFIVKHEPAGGMHNHQDCCAMIKFLPEKPLFSLNEFSQIIGYNLRSIYRMIDASEIKVLRVRNRWMLTYESVVNYLETRKTN